MEREGEPPPVWCLHWYEERFGTTVQFSSCGSLAEGGVEIALGDFWKFLYDSPSELTRLICRKL